MAQQLGTPEVLLDGLVFPEGPRWREGKLWFSDMHAHKVHTVDLDGNAALVCELEDDMPSGLGFLDDGSLLIAAMRTMQVLRWDGSALSVHSDLSGFPGKHLNDMVVSAEGRAYVGCRQPRGSTPADMALRDSPITDSVVRVDPDGTAQVAADGLIAPNGSAITPDGKTLIVAETRASRLSAWDLDADGELSNHRIYADVDPLVPDGIALDAQGGVWFGSPVTGVFARVSSDGEITHRLDLPDGKWGIACALGGEDRRTLFLLTARTTLENLGRLRSSESDHQSDSVAWIETLRVDVPGAGIP